MSKELSHLWRTAKSLELTQEEKIACAQNIGISVREKKSVRQRVHMTEKRLFTLAKELSLSPREKVDAREWIFHRSSRSFSLSSLFRFSSFTSAIASLLIVSIASGGIASAAESAMPDDVLYPIKIHINEPIMASFQRTEEDRLLFTSMQVERRSNELEHLFLVETDNIALVDTVTSLLHQHSSSLSSKIGEIDDAVAQNIEEKTRRIEEHLYEKQKKMVAMKMKNPALQKKISSIHTMLLDARMSLREPSLLNEEEVPSSPDHPFVATIKYDDAPLSAKVMSAPVMDEEEMAFVAQTRLRALKRMQKKIIPLLDDLAKTSDSSSLPHPPSPLPVLMLEESEKEMNAGNIFQANEMSKKAMKEMRKMRKERRE
jgi:hypothetical protein